MTQQTQIVPQYVNPPKEAHWSQGSIKDQGGQLWSVHKDALGMFTKGLPVNVGFEPPYGTKKYPQIVSVNGQPVGQQQAAGFTPAGQAAQAAMPQQQAWQPQTQAPPAQAQTHTPVMSGQYSKGCQIFVTAICGKLWEGTGSFPGQKVLRDVMYECKLAWEIEMEGKPEGAQQGTLQPGQPVPGPEIAGGLRQAAAQHSAHHGGPPPGHPADQQIDDEIPF